jgi:hypothetical protein
MRKHRQLPSTCLKDTVLPMRSAGHPLIVFFSFTLFIPSLATMIISASVAGLYTYYGSLQSIVNVSKQVSTAVPEPPALVEVPRSPITHATDIGSAGPTGSGVTHLNIFWPLLTFILAYFTQPLNGTIRVRSNYQIHALITLAGSLFDILYLSFDILYPSTHHYSHCILLSRGRVANIPQGTKDVVGVGCGNSQ